MHAPAAPRAPGKCTFDFELTRRDMGPRDKWYADSLMARGLNAHLVAHSAVLAPRTELKALLDRDRTDAYAEALPLGHGRAYPTVE